ncbi:MAG: hypothetical protein FWD58_07835 [Firmicutes bacterium]|nr:hypothetical protein [Bacillota bacterium]
MYQFNMSVNQKNAGWFSAIEKTLAIKLRALDGVVASKDEGQRVEISIACENGRRSEAEAVISRTLSEMYLTVCKYEYLHAALKIPSLARQSYKILIHTLVVFDREAESEIVEKNLVLGDYLALDGFFYFRLGELKKRWDEIAQLASSNSLYLSREETLNELLKFLMSAVTPKIPKLSISVDAGHYNVSGRFQNSDFEFRITSADKLLIYLINAAPLELTLDGKFPDERLYKRIVSIFDGKGNG